MGLENFITQDENAFYFDLEKYEENDPEIKSLNYQDGDIIKWRWEGKTMFGTLRGVGYEQGLFCIQNVRVKD